MKAFLSDGKTATSQTLPRSEHRIYIALFSDLPRQRSPQVIGLVVIHDPKGVYYGGTIAAPVMKEIFENALLTSVSSAECAEKVSSTKTGVETKQVAK